MDIKTTPKKKQKQSEHYLQSLCVNWFRLQYPKLAFNLFAIPNGAKRHPVSGRWYKKEGLTAGVSDCFLALPCKTINVYDGSICYLHGVFIEFKSKTGTQTDKQRLFEKSVREQDYDYWLVNNFDEFVFRINKYLENK